MEICRELGCARRNRDYLCAVSPVTLPSIISRPIPVGVSSSAENIKGREKAGGFGELNTKTVGEAYRSMIGPGGEVGL